MLQCFQPRDDSKSIYEGVWIGANDLAVEGKFVWAGTGQPVSYTFWGGANPDNWEEEDCVQLMPSNNGRWNDISCTTGYTQTTLCERVTTPCNLFPGPVES